jgi:ubiquinone/menaquinone biosynthesis C-methylase UbiE
MNAEHMELCASDDWRWTVRELILPWTLGDTDLGDDVLEVGPGFGVTTDILRTRARRLTAIEIHDELATALAERLKDSNVEVVHGDATVMPFEDARFTGAASFSMLHHVPSPALQDRLLAEVARVLQPGGVLVAGDSIDSEELRAFHHDDTYTPLDPSGVEARLRGAGFADIAVKSNEFGWAAIARTCGSAA